MLLNLHFHFKLPNSRGHFTPFLEKIHKWGTVFCSRKWKAWNFCLSLWSSLSENCSLIIGDTLSLPSACRWCGLRSLNALLSYHTVVTALTGPSALRIASVHHLLVHKVDKTTPLEDLSEITPRCVRHTTHTVSDVLSHLAHTFLLFFLFFFLSFSGEIKVGKREAWCFQAHHSASHFQYRWRSWVSYALLNA